jgi:two-component system chemotaxis sensor kinase CheA
MQVKSLLEQSQSLTEELQTQSEELQVQHEELRSINEQLAKQYHDSEKKTKELENTKRELEEQAKQLEISSQFKSEFLANMSHELRTPLNSMLILAQIFAENKEGNLTEKQVDYAHSIHYAGKDLLNLINDILDLSKVESGKIEIIPSKVSLSDIQRDIERQFIPVAAQKGLIFQIEPDQDPALTLTTDEQRVMQILKNLLSNAFKFTEEGRVILKFRTPQIHDFKKKNVPSNTVLAISVSDTGIGIPQEKQDIIFEAFRQADGTMSRKHGGTGLGLSISRELAQLLGGTLLVESEVGQGSTFTLYLPNLSLAISEAQPAPVEPTLGFSDLPFEVQVASSTEWNDLLGKKILIVDDDMRNVFALTTLFEKQNMSVVFAENGKDSIDTLLAHPGIDIILMDIMMPEMDGYTAMRAIRKIPDYHTIPIIALTAKAMKNDREKCIEAGASDYISKPINVEQLLSLIRVWLYPRKG